MNSLGIIVDQPECRECCGLCCFPDRLEFPVPEGTTMGMARAALGNLGLYDGQPLEVRVNEYGRTVVRTYCPRRWGGLCDPGSRPAPCLQFPASYLADDHSDAERAEIREFCALFRRLELDEVARKAHDETLHVKGKVDGRC